ncbi:MAG: hypothetical protein IKA17_10735 [Clostridia bacterium]|nr:hypothetical protein [Clostridia bacterium]
MKQIRKRCILFWLILCLLMPYTAFAETTDAETGMRNQIMPELDYIDKVYKYDVTEKDKAPMGGDSAFNNNIKPMVEVSQFPVEIGTVVGLNLMSLSEDGTFDSMGFVPYNEYAYIVSVLMLGREDGYFKDMYDSADTSLVTQEQAIKGILDGLGYGVVCEKTSYYKVAIDTGLIKNLNYSAQKNITRGELAKLIYNALTIGTMEPSQYGADMAYSVNSDFTLLWNVHSAVKIEGVVTAAGGVDLYSTVMPDEKYIYIDKVAYLKGNIDDTNLLGQQVFGYAVTDGDEYTIIYLDYNQRNETITIPLVSISEIRNNVIYYSDENGNHKQSIKNVKRIVYNNDIADDYVLTEDILNSEGELTICNLKDGLDAIIINEYQSFGVASVSAINGFITLKHGMSFNGSNKLDLYVEGVKDKRVTYIKNGKPIGLKEIKGGDVISVCANKAGTIYKIVVSDNIIRNGSVSELDSEEVTIGNNTYKVSEGYYKARENDSSVSPLTVGAQGKFYVTYDNRIVDFTERKNLEYGILRGVQGNETFGDVEKVQIKVFTEGGSWEIYSLAKLLEFDGAAKKSYKDVYNSLRSTDYSEEGVFDNLVQYKLNSDDEIVFLDTIVDTDAEIASGNSSRLRYNGTWEGELDWTVNTNLATLEGSRYKLMNQSTVVFSVPNNLDAENKYAAIKVSSLPSETNAKVKIYSADDYFRAGAIIENHTGGGSAESFYRMVVDKVIKKLDSEGNYVTAVKTLMLDSSGTCNNMEYILSEESEAIASTLKRGDVLLHTYMGDNSINVSVLIDSSFEEWVESIYDPAGGEEEMYGTVHSIDFENNFIAVRVGEELYSYEFEGAILYDRANDTLAGASLEELSEGDKIYNRGSNSRGRFVVYR